MNNEEYEFILLDRIAKIKAINEQYDLEHNSYIAFSGGKDSVVLSHLIDIALPDNKIPRLFSNTGIEFVDMVKYVKDLSINDKRIIIRNNRLNIKKTLNNEGYPFKSKEHSQKVYEAINQFKRKGFISEYLTRYKNGIHDYIAKDGTMKKNLLVCPKILRYQFEKDYTSNISKFCCDRFKKEPMYQFEKEYNKTIVITGMRKSEGGNRMKLTCLTHNNTKFHPLLVVSDVWEDEFIKRNNINLCKLYYPPYDFNRTGCKGCPYNKNIQKDLETLYKLLPKEYYQCIHLWKPVYDEYIKIGYRLKYYPHERSEIENEI